MDKQELFELIKEKVKQSLEEAKNTASILEPILGKVRDATSHEKAKEIASQAVSSSKINQNDKDRMLKTINNSKNLPDLQKYIYNAYLAKSGLRSPDANRRRRYEEQEINERHRPNLESKGYEAAQKVIQRLRESVFPKLDNDELLEFRHALADALNLKNL